MFHSFPMSVSCVYGCGTWPKIRILHAVVPGHSAHFGVPNRMPEGKGCLLFFCWNLERHNIHMFLHVYVLLYCKNVWKLNNNWIFTSKNSYFKSVILSTIFMNVHEHCMNIILPAWWRFMNKLFMNIHELSFFKCIILSTIFMNVHEENVHEHSVNYYFTGLMNIHEQTVHEHSWTFMNIHSVMNRFDE